MDAEIFSAEADLRAEPPTTGAAESKDLETLKRFLEK